MLKKRRLLIALCSSLCIFVLILDSKTAMRSAIEGLRLCLYTVIPALFPFFICSTLLTGALQGATIPIPNKLRNALGIPRGGESLLAVGLLGGYPVGAHCIAQLHAGHGISSFDARRMLGYCVNAGPAFIFGICSILFSSPIIPWCLWGIHIASALITASLLPGKKKISEVSTAKGVVSIPDAVGSAVKNIAQVCGWIIMVRVFIGFLDRWFLWLLPQDFRALLLGAAELTNGCTELSGSLSEELRFVLCSALLSFGGLSVYMQVLSVTGELGTGMYLHGKLLQCAISTLLAFLMHYTLFPTHLELQDIAIPGMLLAAAITGLIPFTGFYKNNGSISVKYHV